VEDSALDVGRVPYYNGGDDEIEAASSVLLAFEGSIAQSAEAMEAYGPSEGIAGLALVQLCDRLPTQRRIVQPVEGEGGAFDPPDFAERQRESVLPMSGAI